MKRNRIIIVVLVMAAVLLAATSAWSASTLTKLGRHPFYQPPLTSLEDLRYMVKKQMVDIMAGFEQAGLPEFFEDFDRQFPDVVVDQIKVNKGETLQWMFYKRNGKGKVRIARDVTWAADEPFDAFRFYIEHAGHSYEIVVPWTCGNIALGKVEKIAPPPPEPPKPKPNLAPTCGSSLSASSAICDQEITVDASGSSDSDGKVTAVLIRLEDLAGNTLWEQSLDKPPFAHTFKAPCQAGQYQVRTIAIDDIGAESAPDQCVHTLTVTPPETRKGFPVIDVGLFRIIDPATFVAVRIGYEYYLSKAFSIMGLVGPYIKFEGDDSASALALDILLLYHVGDRFYMGLGAGYWYSDKEEDGVDLIANLGVRVAGEPDSTHVSIYLEARSAVDQFDELWEKGRFGGGFRVNF